MTKPCRKERYPSRPEAVAAARKTLRTSFDLGAVAGVPVHALPAVRRCAGLTLGASTQGEGEVMGPLYLINHYNREL